MGHVLEKILADVIARWWRLSGDDVRFQIGTDEHGVKIQQTADREGVSPQKLVDRNVPLFRGHYDQLHISYDRFIRTTDHAMHWPTVQELWKRLQKSGALEKRTYKGLYCSGCEKFMTKKDLLDGKCPDHQKVPEEVCEENWFFLLRREGKWLRDLLMREDGYHVVPIARSHETLSLIDQGLEDVSFSRSSSSLSWGIPVPGDPEQTMYVWCDALTNYISGLGYFTGHDEKEWWEGAEVTHVIGKDIARFHALIWPAMLKHAGVRTPDRLLIHGFLTSDGQKMSKTIGNVVDPEEVLKRFTGNPDPLRFYLSHEIPVGNDGDFSWKRIEELYDSKLRNQLGNLLNRVLVLLKKESAFNVPDTQPDSERASEGWKKYSESMDSFELHLGISQAMELVETLNQGIDHIKPWTLKGVEKLEVLCRFAESLRHVALKMLPFVPSTAQDISRQLGVPYAEKMLDRDFVITPELREWGSQKAWKAVGEPKILFPPL